jgi:TonB family protein
MIDVAVVRRFAVLIALAAGCAHQPVHEATLTPVDAPLSTSHDGARETRGVMGAYLTAMHRAIHPGWTEQYLSSLDRQPPDSPGNDKTRWTQVAIVLDAQGRVESVTTIRASSYPPFDAAAVATVRDVGTFPPPPEPLRSYDGKFYVDWTFHRDDVRGCSIISVEPHIFHGVDEQRALPARAP